MTIEALDILYVPSRDVATEAEFPLGRLAVLRTPGGQRIGLYEATRPAMLDGFAGRQDFS